MVLGYDPLPISDERWVDSPLLKQFRVHTRNEGKKRWSERCHRCDRIADSLSDAWGWGQQTIFLRYYESPKESGEIVLIFHSISLQVEKSLLLPSFKSQIETVASHFLLPRLMENLRKSGLEYCSSNFAFTEIMLCIFALEYSPTHDETQAFAQTRIIYLPHPSVY